MTTQGPILTNYQQPNCSFLPDFYFLAAEFHPRSYVTFGHHIFWAPWSVTVFWACICFWWPWWRKNFVDCLSICVWCFFPLLDWWVFEGIMQRWSGLLAYQQRYMLFTPLLTDVHLGHLTEGGFSWLLHCEGFQRDLSKRRDIQCLRIRFTVKMVTSLSELN